MRLRRILIERLGMALIAMFCGIAGPAKAQAPAVPVGPIQPWGLPPLPAGEQVAHFPDQLAGS